MAASHRVLLCIASASVLVALPVATGLMIVDLRSQPPSTILAVQVCAGLINRNKSSSLSAYTLMHPEDTSWLYLVEPTVPAPPPLTSTADFMQVCLSKAAVGRLRYNFSNQQALVPNLLTVAAVLDCVPLEDDSPFLPPALPVVFDAIATWATFSPLNASEFVYDRYVGQTTTLAKMDPGYNYSHPLDPTPPLTGCAWRRRRHNFRLHRHSSTPLLPFPSMQLARPFTRRLYRLGASLQFLPRVRLRAWNGRARLRHPHGSLKPVAVSDRRVWLR